MDAAKVELLRALGRVVRGLSTLFWGLPAMLIVDAETARTDWLGFLGGVAFAPGMAMGGVLYYGLRQLRHFQKQERIWQQSLNRAELLAVLNTGLAPFLCWWHRFPEKNFFLICAVVMAFSIVLFFMQINQVMRRLCAMIPDEPLREETKMFARVNIAMFLIVFLGAAGFIALDQMHMLPRYIEMTMAGDDPRGLWFILFFGLMPVAMTLAILWKIKEVIFMSIFEAEH